MNFVANLNVPVSEKQRTRNHPKIKVTHILSGLIAGGAETMLYKLLSVTDREKFVSEVISLTDEGQLGRKIEALGVKVTTLGMPRGLPTPWGIRKLWNYLQKNPPDIIQTWMYHADLIGGGIARKVTAAPVVWNVRADVIPFSQDPKTYFITKVCALFSSLIPRKVISCSESARKVHIEIGYEAAKMLTIPNGFDLENYHPDPQAYTSVRKELGIDLSMPLIGLITRFDQRKDLPNFFAAAALLRAQMAPVQFLLCGNGIGWENKNLVAMIENAGVREHCFLLGRRDDIPRLTAALDVAASSSESEGFPNVLGEAMACGVPCVATDVGDSAYIIGSTGIIVPPRNAEALAAGWKKILSLNPEEKRMMGQVARQRIEEQFSLRSVTARYENLYSELIDVRSVN